ncbi:PREDICTED: uncharacterized protein LOC105556002 [Vollenhovia emeryi]|uniref:uncharacterized protein LOC105556002 n=1 Tax=Vollenhovia emeryi TaxID=411798 RepID=UPI0005F541F1|nr:PREDICTED: uncharacterized protein LOC105556002 [Vollenhovia emeryi]
MALGYLALDLMDMEDRIQHLERRARQVLRITEDPFDLTHNEFRELYRLTPDLMFDLVDMLEPRLQRTRITGLSTEKQILAAVRFYATGCFQCPVGEQWVFRITTTPLDDSKGAHKRPFTLAHIVMPNGSSATRVLFGALL